MSYTTEIYGGLGNKYQPSPRQRSLIAIGILKPGGDQPSTRWNIITNGDIVLQDPHEARYKALIATATVPVITIPRIDPTLEVDKATAAAFIYRDAIGKFLNEKTDDKAWSDPDGNGGFWKLLKYMDGKTGNEVALKQVKPSDILVKTWPLYQGHGFMYFQTEYHDHILTTAYEAQEIFDGIQAWASRLLMENRFPLTKWAPLGFGIVRMSNTEAPKLVKRPGRNTKFQDNYAMKMMFPSLTNALPDMAYYNFWLELLAGALKLVVTIDGYEPNDYLALAWHIIYQGNGIGKNTRPDEYPLNTQDIIAQIMDNIGDDSNEAYSFRFADASEWKLYLAYSIIKGMVMSRIDAEEHAVEFYITAGDKLTAVEALRRLWHADYDEFGSETTPWYVPARTDLRDEVYLPCVIDMDAETVNEWVHIPPIEGDRFTKVKVEHGEVMSNVLEPLDPNMTYIEWDLSTNDCRRWEIKYRRHIAIVWEFRIHGYTDDIIGRRGRMLQFFLAQLTGTPQHWKKGYICKYGLGIIMDPGVVHVANNRRYRTCNY